VSSPAYAASGTGPASLTDLDEARLRGVHWRWTSIAALGDYLDAGSIVAGGAALPLWTSYLHFGSTTVSLIAAFSSNGISTGIGALIAGRLGDKFGRKFIFAWDLLIYALGAVIVAAAVNGPMLILGYILLGLAVGIDVPTTWSLIAEFAPRRRRGMLMSLTNIAWYVGPIVILLLALAFHPLGLLGARLLFVSLLVVALATYGLRRMLTESPRWSLQTGRHSVVEEALERLRGTNPPGTGQAPGDGVPGPAGTAGVTAGTGETAAGTDGPGAAATAGSGPGGSVPGGMAPAHGTAPAPAGAGAAQPAGTVGYRGLFQRKYVRRLLFITPIYVLWGIPAGTYGFFEPTLFKTVGAHSLATSDGLDILWFASAIIAVLVVFMPLNDRVDRRILYAISAALCGGGFFLIAFAPVSNIWVAIGNILLFGFGQGVGLWPLQRIWSVELFPTSLRNTGQGFLWSIMRIILGLWSFFLADVTGSIGFSMVALMLALMFMYNLVVGGIFGPRTGGKSLEEI
jgi:MFS family permease